VKIRDYRGLLAVFVAGAIGISLLCSVSGMAIQDLNASGTAGAFQPENIVDSAVNNLNTAGALTLQAIAEFIPTATRTLRPTSTSSPSATLALMTPTAFRFPTLSEPTRTRRPRRDPTKTSVPPPTRTPVPTWTNSPIPTNTLRPTDIPPSPTDIPPSPTDIPPSPTDIPPSPTDIPPSPTTGIPITGATETPMP
jgi:hypothetical protein